MTITVKAFASLREELGFEKLTLEHNPVMTIEGIWSHVCDIPAPSNLLCAVNHEYANFNQQINDGDEVAFFPPVNGG